MRISEALGLRWRDLDTAARTITVAGRVRDGQRGPVKSAQGERTIPIPGALARDLAAHRLASRWSEGEDYVLGTGPRLPLTKTSAYRALRDATVAARVPWCGGFHGLRRSAASAWLAGGVPLTVVAQLLGHWPGVTVQHYAYARSSDVPSGDELARFVGAM